MGDPKPKTATVSVPPKATVNIKVRFKLNNAPVVGALGFSTRPGEGARNLGKTNTGGQLKNLKFDPGQVDISLVFKNHRGEGMPQAIDTNPNSTLVFSGVLTPGTRDIDVLMVQVASQVTVTVVDSISGLPLAGTKVTTGLFSGSGNGKGVVVTDGLAMGLLHTVTAVHAGFGPEGGTVEGPVSSTVDLRKATAVTNSALTLKMKPIFGKVKSSNITVEGKLFPDFYRDTFVPGFPKFHPTIRIQGVAQLSFPAPRPNFDPLQFNKLFNDIPKWAGAPELTIEEFVSCFLIFANETGGAFKPIPERGSLSHMFYLNNKGGNRPAGDQLRARGIISDQATIDAWNVTGRINPRTSQCDNFPGTSPGGPTDADVAECDFNKYRGRGFVQLTNFPNYQTFLDPSLLAAGLADSEHLTNAQLDDAVLNNETVYYGTLGSYLNRIRNSWGLTNSEQWRQFGLTVAGQNNTGYGDLFQFRAENLFARLMQAARTGQLELK